MERKHQVVVAMEIVTAIIVTLRIGVLGNYLPGTTIVVNLVVAATIRALVAVVYAIIVTAPSVDVIIAVVIAVVGSSNFGHSVFCQALDDTARVAGLCVI